MRVQFSLSAQRERELTTSFSYNYLLGGMVDALVLGTSVEIRVSSSLTEDTIICENNAQNIWRLKINSLHLYYNTDENMAN